MKIAIPVLLLFLVMASTFRGQENGMQLIDEFGRPNDEERLSRISNLSFLIRNNPDKIGLIHISGGRDFSPSASYLFGALFRAQLINHSKLDASRFEIQNCGVNDPEIVIRLYIAARDAKRPDCDTTLPVFEKAALFGIAFEDYPDACCETIGGSDSIAEVFSDTLAKLLEKDPGSKVSLIGYAGTNVYTENETAGKTKWVAKKRRGWDNPTVVTRKLQKAEKYLLGHKIAPSRISKINAGYRNTTSNIEFWFIPAGYKAPKPTPDYRVGKPVKKRR
jgi:hypothetical protein